MMDRLKLSTWTEQIQRDHRYIKLCSLRDGGETSSL